MARRFPVVGAAACLAAGVSLWFTRASLDVLTVGGRETRVAMLPSWPELAGLCVLVFLVAALVWPRVAGSLAWPLAPAGRSAARVADLALPLFTLLWLGVPYAPWIADVVPAWRALAGPAKYGVWLLVAGHLAWLASDAAAGRAGARAARFGPTAQLLVVLAVSVLVFATAASRLAGGPLRADSDEPHYLVITQSLLADGDLDIANNHARGDYRQYVPGPMEPHAAPPGRGGATYSVHGVGLPILLMPAFAAGGQTGVVVWLVTIGALAATLMWQLAAHGTGSVGAAVLAWMAVGLSAPWVLHTHSVHPEVAAAAVVLLAVGLAVPSSPRGWTAAARGAALAVLPWLGARYAPLSLALLVLIAWRQAARREALVALVLPWCASIVAWLYFFHSLWGSWSPLAPHGAAGSMSAGSLAGSVAALLVDQEYGVLPYAPAFLLAVPGLWQLWQDGGEPRRRAIEAIVAVGVLAASVGSQRVWWGIHAAPGGGLVAVLPLLALPIARWAAGVRANTVQIALGRTLVLAGLAVTAAIVFAGDGLLVANARDGSSALLEWLAPGRELVRAAPAAAGLSQDPWLFAVTALAWVLVLLLIVWGTRRFPQAAPGAAAAVAVLVFLGSVGLTASGLSYAIGSRVPALGTAGSRGESALLHDFDARRRPLAVVYDPWRRVEPGDVLQHVSFEATPGLRRRAQPVRVLLNMRLLLPAGRYRVTVEAADNAVAEGPIGLQVGLMGKPLYEWTMHAVHERPWRQEFELPMNARFVGFRVDPDLERRVASVRVEPLSIVNASDRPEQPPVMSAARYGDTAVMFHGTGVYPETNGFWVRGESTLMATIAPPPDRTREHGIRLSMHSGARENRVELATPTWRTTVLLEPGVSRQLVVPTSPGQRVVPLRISTEGGFVPADTDGGKDQRLLGCWVEVLP